MTVRDGGYTGFCGIRDPRVFDAATSEGWAIEPIVRGLGSEYCNAFNNNLIEPHSLMSGDAYRATASVVKRALLFRVTRIEGQL